MGLEQLKQRYHASLSEKSAALGEQWEAVTQSKFSIQALTALQQSVHRLAGSTGMYGYHRLAELARELEICLSEPAPADSAWRAKISAAVLNLRRSLQAQEPIA